MPETDHVSKEYTVTPAFTICATCNVTSPVQYVLYYYYYYYYYYYPFSLLHSSLTGSQNNTCLTDEALLNSCSVRIFLTIRCVLTAFCIGIHVYRPTAGRRLRNNSSFKSAYFWSFSVWRCGGCDCWELLYIGYIAYVWLMVIWSITIINYYYYYYYHHHHHRHHLFMQGIYTYIPETNYVPREYSLAAILLFLFMVLISLVCVEYIVHLH